MRQRSTPPSDETRAEVARRRLAQLAASFDAQLPPAEPAPETPVVRPRIERSHVKVLATIGVAAGVLLVWWMLSGRPQTTDPAAPLALPTTAASREASAPDAPSSSASAGAELVVDVVGKVRRPGIVTVPRGSRVFEAIKAAGGLKGRPDTTSINMARVLVDGEQILVGVQEATVPGSGPASGTTAPAGKVNLNTATAEQLDTLPGVGPVTAQAILSWRDDNGRFGAVEDLLEVKGIGEATLADLRDLVTV